MRSTYITAIVIAVAVIVWIWSGQLEEDPPPPAASVAEQNQKNALLAEEKPPVQVRVARSYAQERHRIVHVRGRTRSKRIVEVKAQIMGTVAERPVERGDRVAAGDLLCRISDDERTAVLEEAKQAVNQAQIEFEGSQKLAKQGLQSETAIAQARARLASAKAQLKRSELAVERLNIRAPFSGMIEQVGLEVGDYVTTGAACVELVELDPMLLVGRIPEKELVQVSAGGEATARLASGQKVTGTVSFVGKTADEATRTYALEVQIDNASYEIPSGISASIDIPVATMLVHKITPALLSLDDAGRTGVRTMDSNNQVEFYHVEIIADDEDGIWISGLPEVTTLITVGQELVVAGEVVEPTWEDINTAAPVSQSESGNIVAREGGSE